MKKKNVLLLCQYFYPEYISSATLPFDTAKELSRAGFSVGVICGYPKEYSNNLSIPEHEYCFGLEIRRLRYLQLRRNHTLGRLINYLSFTLSALTRLYTMRNYESIMVYSNPPILPLVAVLAKKIFGVKIIFVCYDVYPEIAIKTKTISENSLIANAMRYINNILFKNLSKVVVLSTDMEEFILKNRVRLNKDKLIVIPNWVSETSMNINVESYNKNIFDIKAFDNKFVVSYFGNLGIAQDAGTLIEAIKILNDDSEIVFVFAGHGNKFPQLKETIFINNLENVYIYDFFHGKVFQDALTISNVFIVTLASGLEGLAVPSKTYNYLMAGKPVISIMDKNTDICRELVENNAGFSIEVGDVEGLVESIKFLKNEPKAGEIMGKNSEKLFLEKYTVQIGTKKYIELIKSVMEDETYV
jgi:glycosyltransferase involved in cell wall biosynthesis